MKWEVHRQAYVCRALSNEPIPSSRKHGYTASTWRTRRSRAKALVWLALALLVPGGSVVAFVVYLVKRRGL